jgi:hypothetical protein
MTKWYKPSERLPDHNQQVLVREDDFIELATFDKQSVCFHLRNGSTKTPNDKILWMNVAPAN